MIRAWLLCFLFFFEWRVFAQADGTQIFVDSAAVAYLRFVGNQSALYSGKEQKGYLRSSNHPYLKDVQYTKARLSYRRIIYPDALLRLDLNRNELMVLSPDLRNIVLHPESVDYAELHGQRIIYFRRDSLPGCPPTGYYIMLYSEKIKVLKKQDLTLIEKSEPTGINRNFETTTRFYLYKDGVYHSIRNKNGLLKVLHPYQKELKHFISAHRLRYRHNVEEFLTRTVGEYEKISGQL